MKKLVIVVILILSFLNIESEISAATWQFRWENTEVDIPLGESVEKYKGIPKAYLYKDNVCLTDANVSISSEGDWMYYLSDVNTKKVGTYEVWYKAYENYQYRPGTCSGYKCKITFNVYDAIAPTLKTLEEHIVVRLNSDYNPLSNIIVSDNYDSELEVGYSSNLDLTKNGTYDVEVYAYDSSLNMSTVEFKVTVNSEPPVIRCNNQKINIGLNSIFNITDYFSAHDEILGDVTSYIEYGIYDDQNDVLLPLDTSELGAKELTLRIKIQNHTVIEKYIINIVDDEAPVMCFNEKDLNEGITLDYNFGYQDYDFLKHVTISDNVEVDYNNLTFKTNCENKVGSYTVWYYYTDSVFSISGSLPVRLISYTPPAIKTENITIYQNEEFDINDYFSVTDSSDPNISSKVSFDGLDADFSIPGIYYVYIHAVNTSGRSTEAKIKVEVLEEELVSEEEVSKNNGNMSSSETKSDSKSETGFFLYDNKEELKSDLKYIIIIVGLCAALLFFLVKSKRKKINN